MSVGLPLVHVPGQGCHIRTDKRVPPSTGLRSLASASKDVQCKPDPPGPWAEVGWGSAR